VKRALLYTALIVWFLAVLAAFGFVWRYKTQPGPNTNAPRQWPRVAAIVPAQDKANLVMFVHPHCPCSRASVAELARLAVEIGGRAQIHVVLVRPRGTDPGFEDGTLAERARAITGARVVVDDAAVEAERFGAQTSGAVVLYTRTGELAFSGGLTTARGHEGEGPAHAKIRSVLAGSDMTAATAPTFGCELEQIKTRGTP
jgi:hypothetical protein